MEERRVSPHILRRTLEGEQETVADVNVEGGRALLVFADGERAGEFKDRTPGAFADSEAVSVSPAEISRVCAHHGLASVALYGFLKAMDLSVVSVETVPEIFGAME